MSTGILEITYRNRGDLRYAYTKDYVTFYSDFLDCQFGKNPLVLEYPDKFKKAIEAHFTLQKQKNHNEKTLPNYPEQQYHISNTN